MQWRADLPKADDEWKELACNHCPAHFLVDNVGQIKRTPKPSNRESGTVTAEDTQVRYIWLNMDTDKEVSEKSLRKYADRFRGGSWKSPGLPVAWEDSPVAMAYGTAPFTMAEVEALAKRLAARTGAES